MVDFATKTGNAERGGAPRDPVLRVLRLTLGVIASVLLMAMMLITTVDVVGRYLFTQPLPGAFELSEIMLALIVFTALPLVCLHDEHVRVSIISDRLGPRGVAIQGVLTSLFGAGVLVLVAWRVYEHAMQLASYGDVTMFLRIPKGPIGVVLAACALIAALMMVLVAWRHARRLVAR